MSTILIIQSAIISAGTVFLVYISRKSLLKPKSHGFYRFFVFASCLLLVSLNLPYWIMNPFTYQQIISWISLIISIYLLFQSFYSLKKFGGSKEREIETANFNFENTANLIRDGIYKYIRHPMYCSLLFLSLGAFLKNISAYSIVLTIISVLFLIFTAKAEEKENIKFFGSLYTNYMEETKKFVPFIF